MSAFSPHQWVPLRNPSSAFSPSIPAGTTHLVRKISINDFNVLESGRESLRGVESNRTSSAIPKTYKDAGKTSFWRPDWYEKPENVQNQSSRVSESSQIQKIWEPKCHKSQNDRSLFRTTDSLNESFNRLPLKVTEYRVDDSISSSRSRTPNFAPASDPSLPQVHKTNSFFETCFSEVKRSFPDQLLTSRTDSQKNDKILTEKQTPQPQSSQLQALNPIFVGECSVDFNESSSCNDVESQWIGTEAQNSNLLMQSIKIENKGKLLSLPQSIVLAREVPGHPRESLVPPANPIFKKQVRNCGGMTLTNTDFPEPLTTLLQSNDKRQNFSDFPNQKSTNENKKCFEPENARSKSSNLVARNPIQEHHANFQELSEKANPSFLLSNPNLPYLSTRTESFLNCNVSEVEELDSKISSSITTLNSESNQSFGSKSFFDSAENSKTTTSLSSNQTDNSPIKVAQSSPANSEFNPRRENQRISRPPIEPKSTDCQKFPSQIRASSTLLTKASHDRNLFQGFVEAKVGSLTEHFAAKNRLIFETRFGGEKSLPKSLAAGF